MYKVFINNNPLYFIDSLDKVDIRLNNHIFSYKPESYIPQILSYLEDKKSSENDDFYFYAKDIHAAWEHFFSFYKYIEAAGGVVKNKNNELLFIYRFDTWDLPKGKVERDEIIHEAALREVKEECGITAVLTGKEFRSTFHTYLSEKKKKRILKRTYWFEMTCTGMPVPTPQFSENITQAGWMNRMQLKDIVFKNTYCSIKDVLLEACSVTAR